MTKRNRILSTALLLIAAFAILFSLSSCGGKGYAEIPSSKKEETTVATLGGHEVKYELFRAFFSSMYSGKTDGMTEEDWTAAGTAVMREISYLYALFDVAEEIGVDPYGDVIDEVVDEHVRVAYEGGEMDGYYVEGFGSREKYKEALAASNLTDAVNRLIYRYDATLTELYEYVVENLTYGNETGIGGDARAFFDSDACARGTWIFISDDFRVDRDGGLAYAEELRASLAGADSVEEVRAAMRNTDTFNAPDGIGGEQYVPRHQWESPVIRALTEDTFSLAPYACGEIREDAGGVWFVVGLPKDPADYEKHAGDFFDLMIEENWIDRPVYERAESYLSGVRYSSSFPTFSAEALAELTVQ